MVVKTSKVTGRRELHFGSMDDAVADAQRLAQAGSLTTLGNWSPGQIFQHLANTIDMSIDGSPLRPPWFVKLIARMFKGRLLRRPMPAGFQLPGPAARQLVAPGPVSAEAGLAALVKAAQRLKQESHREPHPVLGALSVEQWNQLHQRHAELHLSFVVPGK